MDRGIVLLIDARLNETRYRRLVRAWWKYSRVRQASGLTDAVNGFWQQWA
jgi:Rad3-related DNA helicase